jgi:hypothetical protein
VRRYEVEVEPAAALAAEDDDPDAPVAGMVKGPYVAETYPVETEGDYVVIDVPA